MDIFSALQLSEIVATVIYSLLGLVLLLVSYAIIDKLTHFSLHEELSEKQNVAVAIVIGSVFIALAILIASVIK
jgi:uncharacterized membrane protein YjfL (UPF0719 family)